MRQVFIGWGVAVKRKAETLLTIYFPHPLLHMRTSHNVEGLLFIWILCCIYIMEVFLLCMKTAETASAGM